MEILNVIVYNNNFNATADLYRPKIKERVLRSWRKGTHTFALSDWQTERIQRRIWLAATTNNTTLMKRLLEFGVSPNNHDNYGRTPLHISASRFIYLYIYIHNLYV